MINKCSEPVDAMLAPGLSRRSFLSGAAGLGLVTLVGCSNSGDPDGAGDAESVLRVGIAGGSAGDNFDAALINGASATTRGQVFYETLTWMDGNLDTQNWLAEDVTANSAGDVWTVKLKKGVEFHNGKALTSADVIFSLKRILNPDIGATAAGTLSVIDLEKLRAVDDTTVEIGLTKPVSFFPALLSNVAYIVPTDYDPAKPISTGPWKMVSYVPGQVTELERFDNYWGEKAKVKKLILQELPDDAARVNAMLAGQVDVINQVPYTQVPQLQSNANLKLSIAETGAFAPITMRTDQAPFDDPRVRQAIRLVMNRDQAVASALHGQGVVAGDVFGRFDPAIEVSPRPQDVTQAKSLLAAAGASDLTVELVVSEVAAGITDACQILVENAKQAGITVNLRKVDAGTFFGNYGEWPFAVDYWVGLPYLMIAMLTQGPDASFLNVTRFTDDDYNAVYEKAVREFDESKRNEYVDQLTAIDKERGGYMVWSFQNTVDAYASKLTGYESSDRTGWGLDRCRLHRVGFG